MYPLKDCRALNFLLHQQEIQIPHDQEISLLLEKLICGSSQGNKALEERLSRGEWISLIPQGNPFSPRQFTLLGQ